MIAIPRRTIRRFVAASSKCVLGRPKGLPPPVVIRRTRGRVTLTAIYPEVVLELTCAERVRELDEVQIVPAEVLVNVNGATDDTVEFAAAGKLRGTASWTEHGAKRSEPLNLILPAKQHDPLPVPTQLATVHAHFLAALHEAGKVSSREDGRFALSRLQIKGHAGQVIATDGKVAVLFDGFRFPFTEDVLTPVVPLFGCPEVRDEKDVRVGRTQTHVVVRAGGWTVWLAIAPLGKFPDVASVIPRKAPTTVRVDERNAAELLAMLPGLPGASHEHRPVTLDADGVLTVRACDESGGNVEAAALARSPVTGPAVQVVLDRRVLAKALSLGCHTLRLTPDKAVVAEGDGVTLLAAPLDPALAATKTDPGSRTPNPLRPAPAPNPITHNPQWRTEGMKSHEQNGDGRQHPHPPNDQLDPLTAAEELRVALGEALAKAGRLVAALKAGKKEKKALANVYAGLRQLNLGDGYRT